MSLKENLPRNFIFEFAGMPKSGKTTTMDSVAHHFRRNGIQVTEYHGGGRHVEIDKDHAQDLNMALTAKAIQFALTSPHQYKYDPRIIIMDRGLFDKYIFTLMYLKRGKIQQDEAAAIQAMISLPRLAGSIDQIFAFVTSPALSLEREHRNTLDLTHGRVMNKPVLEDLREATIHYSKPGAHSFKDVKLIDTEELNNDVKSTALMVVDRIREIISNG